MKKLFRFHLGQLTDEGQSKNRSWQVTEGVWELENVKEIDRRWGICILFGAALDLLKKRVLGCTSVEHTLCAWYWSALEQCVWGRCRERGTVRENVSIDCGLLSYRWQLWHQIKADRSWRTARREICCLRAANKPCTLASSARTLE